MSATRSFQLRGRVGPRSVGLCLVYVRRGVYGRLDWVIFESRLVTSVFCFSPQLMVHTAVGCGFSRTYNVLRIVVWGHNAHTWGTLLGFFRNVL